MSHLFVLNRVAGLMGGTDLPVSRPRVPAGIAWGQATSMDVGADKNQCVLLHCDDATAASVASGLLPGERYAGKVLGDSDRGRLLTALSTPSPRFDAAAQAFADVRAAIVRGDSPAQVRGLVRAYEALEKQVNDWHRGPLEEWHDSYRLRVLDVEQREIKRRNVAAAKAIGRAVALLGINLGLAWAFRQFGVALALTLITSDGFTGNNNPITGRSFDLAAGGSSDTWATGKGALQTTGGRFAGNSAGNAYASSMTDMADGEVTETTSTGGTGPMGRVNTSSGANYLAWKDDNLYKASAWDNYSSIASGTAVGAGVVISVVMSGTTITRRTGGSTNGTATDSSYSTGKAGIFAFSSGSCDDFRVDSNDGGGGGGIVKTIDGLAIASVKTIDGLAIASVKTFNGAALS